MAARKFEFGRDIRTRSATGKLPSQSGAGLAGLARPKLEARMRTRSLPILLIFTWAALNGALQAQSPAESVLQSPPVISVAEAQEQAVHRSGWYGDAGVLIAPPILFSTSRYSSDWHAGALPPVPAPFATVGFRRASDVSWQASFLLVPLIDPRHSIFEQPVYLGTTGLDIDRISTNRSPWENIDLRWDVGLRVVGIGVNGIPIPFAMGPHAGLKFEYPLAGSLFLNGWADIGVLPSLFYGIPLIDLRNELGLTWRPQRRPGLGISVSLFNELAGTGVGGGFLTPGIKARFAWNY